MNSMEKSHSAYDFVLNLIPHLEVDVEKNSATIKKVSQYVDNLNLKMLGKNARGELSLFDEGIIRFPYYSFGSVKSYFHLEYRELVLFAIYKSILGSYSRFLDVGGNLGLHSLFVSKMARCEVLYFEPDPNHYSEALRRFELNDIKNIMINRIAVSNFHGKANFVRLINNTTGSHLEGSKNNLYGPVETFEVTVHKLSAFINKTGRTFAKIDIEGAEADALADLQEEDWTKFDCIVEISNIDSAKRNLKLAGLNRLNLFSQKISWNIASSLEELPHHWDQGSVMITRNPERNFFLN